jgi:hypothetical protein
VYLIWSVLVGNWGHFVTTQGRRKSLANLRKSLFTCQMISLLFQLRTFPLVDFIIKMDEEYQYNNSVKIDLGTTLLLRILLGVVLAK